MCVLKVSIFHNIYRWLIKDNNGKSFALEVVKTKKASVAIKRNGEVLHISLGVSTSLGFIHYVSDYIYFLLLYYAP